MEICRPPLNECVLLQLSCAATPHTDNKQSSGGLEDSEAVHDNRHGLYIPDVTDRDERTGLKLIIQTFVQIKFRKGLLPFSSESFVSQSSLQKTEG
jgi:hypothetical protein